VSDEGLMRWRAARHGSIERALMTISVSSRTVVAEFAMCSIRSAVVVRSMPFGGGTHRGRGSNSFWAPNRGPLNERSPVLADVKGGRLL